MSASDFPQLTQFFGGWFHQDWMDDGYESPADIVRDYAQNESANVVRRTLKELETLRAARLTPTRLGKLIVDELGCAYDPAADGKSWRVWLQEVRQQLRLGQTKR